MIKLELPYDNRLIPGTAQWLSELAEKYGVSAKHATTLCFVVETTLEKRVKQPCEGPPIFQIELEERGDTVSVSITDKGLPYVLTEKQREMLRAGLVSSFAFEQLAIDGQRLRFDVEKEPGARPERPVPEKTEETLLDTDIRCRLTGTDDEDILRAIRVMYSTYGFRYIHQDIYRHDHFRSALESGKYISILAENAHGQTVGHVALEEHDWFPGIPEVCNLVVKDFARGLKVSGLLVDATLEAGASKSFEGVYSMPVVHHPISQKLLNKHGFTPCGFYFHVAPSSINGPENDDGNRVDAALCINILNKDKMHLLYLPEECRDFVRGIFDAEGAMYEALPEGESPRPETVMSCRIDTVNRLMEIRVDNVGRDIVADIAARKMPENFDMVEVIMVYLNMNDPHCPAAYSYFRDRGFIFAGCLPGSSAGDYLLLQHLKGAPIIRENKVLEPNYQHMLEQLLTLAG